MRRRPPSSTRTDPLFPDTPLCRSRGGVGVGELDRQQVLAAGAVEDLHRAHGGVGAGAGDVAVEPGDGGGLAFLGLEARDADRSEEHTSELQSLMRISYAVFCLTTNKYNENYYIQLNKMKKKN